MLTPLAFSRDRPAQLDLLLRSVALNGGDLLGPPVVLFRSTSPDFAAGYEICMEEHPDVRFVGEHDFEAQVRHLLNVGVSDLFVALTDDDVLFRHLASFHADPVAAMRDPSVLSFSLRLGLNTTNCYPMHRHQSVPRFVRGGSAMVWDWAEADGDFSYPYSLDGHLLRTADVAHAIVGFPFHNPSTLEDALVAGMRSSPRALMMSYLVSALVGTPLNRTAETHGGNRVSSLPGCSPRELNDRYLDDWRLSLLTVIPHQVDGAHCEFAPLWVRGSEIAKKSAGRSRVAP